MESAKQEKYNLMHDNPVAKHASGGSWMSKHSKSALHFNAPKHNHTHPKGDAAANTGHTGNVKTTRNTSKKNIKKADLGVSMNYSPAEMGHSPLNENETPAERKARLRKENAAELARLKKVKAKREAMNAADANKPEPKPQTRFQALKARIISDLTGKTGKGGPGTSRN